MDAKKPYVITRGKVIFDYSRLYCDTPEKLIRSELFLRILELFFERASKKGSAAFEAIREKLPSGKEGQAAHFVNLFRLLYTHTAEETSLMSDEYGYVLPERDNLFELVENLYNFWRRFERFLYIEARERAREAGGGMDHALFIESNEAFKEIVLDTYRAVSQNLTGTRPRVYRQLPAGANIGILAKKVEWDCPEEYSCLKDVRFIRLSLLEPPTIFYPARTRREGRFEEIRKTVRWTEPFRPDEWFCYPAKVGDLTGLIYFHQDFASLGLSLGNLFEIAPYTSIKGKSPDLLAIFGADEPGLPSNTVYYDDPENGMLVGLVRHTEDADYFGYIKKITLTLHNVAMLKRDRLPLHGAMVSVKLKGGGASNIVIVGDSGAGKSETLMALSALAEEYISEMQVVFDDMGSLGLGANGRVLGYGTEVGAFLRVDDLQRGYEYREIDRSIFMNPDKHNARLVMPITRYGTIVKGYPVDLLLYANNYDQVDDEHPAVELFRDTGEALAVFSSGARLAKGTTDEKGLTHSYFGNPFGAPQRREMHERCARTYFERMFSYGVNVGQIRTRLGIEGCEQEGPKEAAIELFKLIREAAGLEKKAA